jgi:hypothetical protein
MDLAEPARGVPLEVGESEADRMCPRSICETRSHGNVSLRTAGIDAGGGGARPAGGVQRRGPPGGGGAAAQDGGEVPDGGAGSSNGYERPAGRIAEENLLYQSRGGLFVLAGWRERGR